MSDLVREARRNAKNWADKPDSAAMWNRFADHIEQLESGKTMLILFWRLNRRDKKIERLQRTLEDIRDLSSPEGWTVRDCQEYAAEVLENKDE